MIRRITRRAFARDLAALVGSMGSFGLPVKGYPQKPVSQRRVGVLVVSFSPESKEAQAFRQGLRDAGYDEGRDVIIEWQYANGDYARVPELAANLVKSQVEVIVATTTVAALAVKRATSTIPIVMATVADPVGSGVVTSLAHPGGNVTGLSMMIPDLGAKRLQLLKEAVPHAKRVAVLWNPATPWNAKIVEDLKAVGPSLSFELSFESVATSEEFGAAFSAASRTYPQAIYSIDSPLFFKHRATLVKLASKGRLPTIYGEREYVDEGGLISYGTSRTDLLRRSAGYVDKILKGAKPGDLPIEQPTKFELVVNLKTAKTLGLTIPQSILLRADEVIR